MSVISNLNATPNRIEIVVRYVQPYGAKGVTLDQLLAQLSPPSLRRANMSEEGDEANTGGATVAGKVVDESVRMGLVEHFTDDDGTERMRCVVSPDVPVASPAKVRDQLEGVLLDPYAAEAAGQREFPRALAWFLSQDPELPFDFGQNASQRIREQCGPDVNAFGLTNTARAQNFFYWARYLGFAWYLGLMNLIVPDPTVALERYLPCLMASHRTLPLQEVMDALGGLCPVLEGGVVRTEVEELLRTGPRWGSRTLSRSTSLALERLDRRGVVHLEQQPDAPAVLLATWPDPLSFSHITYIEKV